MLVGKGFQACRKHNSYGEGGGCGGGGGVGNDMSTRWATMVCLFSFVCFDCLLYTPNWEEIVSSTLTYTVDSL